MTQFNSWIRKDAAQRGRVEGLQGRLWLPLYDSCLATEHSLDRIRVGFGGAREENPIVERSPRAVFLQFDIIYILPSPHVFLSLLFEMLSYFLLCRTKTRRYRGGDDEIQEAWLLSKNICFLFSTLHEVCRQCGKWSFLLQNSLLVKFSINTHKELLEI